MRRFGFDKCLLTLAMLIVAAGGCSNDTKTSATAGGSAGPRLSSTDPAERDEAAKEAVQKYGANP